MNAEPAEPTPVTCDTCRGYAYVWCVGEQGGRYYPCEDCPGPEELSEVDVMDNNEDYPLSWWAEGFPLVEGGETSWTS